MEWLKKLIEKHTKDGVLNSEELIKEVNTEFPKHAVPKEQYNTLSESKTKLENDIKERDTQLENLKKIDAGGLQAEIERLQGENKTAKETYEKELKDLQLSNAIKLAINGKVHDEDLVAGLVDKEKVIIGNDGKIVGLDEQINSLKESKFFLFKGEQETVPKIAGATPIDGKDGKGSSSDSPGVRFATNANKSASAKQENSIWD